MAGRSGIVASDGTGAREVVRTDAAAPLSSWMPPAPSPPPRVSSRVRSAQTTTMPPATSATWTAGTEPRGMLRGPRRGINMKRGHLDGREAPGTGSADRRCVMNMAAIPMAMLVVLGAGAVTGRGMAAVAAVTQTLAMRTLGRRLAEVAAAAAAPTRAATFGDLPVAARMAPMAMAVAVSGARMTTVTVPPQLNHRILVMDAPADGWTPLGAGRRDVARRCQAAQTTPATALRQASLSKFIVVSVRALRVSRIPSHIIRRAGRALAGI